ncbi:MAG: hypothetical protein HY738_07500 [Bacteroidia bacterium]|nr:hypothetical protein [Bacteroidia bacterium]
MNSLYIINNYIHKFLLRLLILFTGAWFIFIYAVQSQDRFTELEKQLAELSKTIPGLNETVSFSVNGASIQEFLRGVANNTNLNINIDPAINITIVNNFAEVRVMDILFFLCKEYNLKITNIGTILTVSKYEKQQEKTAYTPKELMINYSLDDELLSLELLNDTLHVVAKTITQKTGKNIVLAPGIGNQLVNGFIQNMPFDNVMEKFAFSNNLTIQKTDDNFYLVDKVTATTDIPSVQQRRDQKTGKTDKTQQNENSLVIAKYNSCLHLKSYHYSTGQ